VLNAGQTIAGRYLLVAPIGEGAMGAVWRAEDQTLKRQVAIKFLFVKAARDPQAMIDQFLREARIAASVQHRNVIQTVDFGTIDQFQPFMVMELLNGESLGDRFAREPPLSREQIIHIISLTLRGLAAVHDAGIVHRDLKPQNVFLQRDSDAVYPKILDFGISRSLESLGDRPSAIATQEGMIVGTPDYMSPEQARGEGNIDKRSDIYSMGVILYEGLSGRLPFEAETIGDLIVQIVTKDPPPLRAVCPDVPQSLSDLVTQCIAKQRDHRFADARAMRRALLAAAESALPPARRAAVSIPPPEVAGHAPPPPAGAIEPGRAAPPPTLPQAAADPGRGVTWGDFEGLNAPQLFDSRSPVEGGGAAPAGANPQRIVARLADQIPSLAPPSEAAQAPRRAAERPSQERGAAPDRASAARNGSKGARKAPAPGAQLSAEDALDPLYDGVDQAVPDIDYERVRVADRRSPAQAKAPPRAALQPRQVASSQARRGARSPVFYFPRLGAYVLPIIAVLLAYYAWTRPPLNALPSTPAASGSVQPGSMRDEPGDAPATGSVLSGAADPGLEQLRLTGKGRRANPGQAPAHMRDVVF
jgi:serine/threonine-protein kinase